MTEYISREEALNFELTVEADPEDIQAITKGMALYAEYIKSIPAANVVERELYERALSDVIDLSMKQKKGKWISMMGHSVCNVCGYKGSPILTNFCPNCGAEMKP